MNYKKGKFFLVDQGMTLDGYKSYLKENAHFFEFLKFLNGSALFLSNLKKKVNLLKSYKVKAFCGGTLFEKFFYEKKIKKYLKFLDDKNFQAIEISSGTVDISIKDRIKIIKNLPKEYTVFCEIGSKSKKFSEKRWFEEIDAMLNTSANFIILEGRLSNNAGIYNLDGTLQFNLIKKIINEFGKERIFFEASNVKSQTELFKEFGKDINLGNIHTNDIILVETIRNSLKSETFFD